MGLRPSHRSLRHVDRLPRADDRLRRREDRRGEPSPHAGHAHRHADARRTRTRARPARGAGAATAAGAGSRRLAERAQSGFERKRARRGAEGRPGDQHRGDQRCGGRGRAAHARQPRGLRAGTRRGAGHPRGRRRRLGGRAAGPQGRGTGHGVVLARCACRGTSKCRPTVARGAARWSWRSRSTATARSSAPVRAKGATSACASARWNRPAGRASTSILRPRRVRRGPSPTSSFRNNGLPTPFSGRREVRRDGEDLRGRGGHCGTPFIPTSRPARTWACTSPRGSRRRACPPAE